MSVISFLKTNRDKIIFVLFLCIIIIGMAKSYYDDVSAESAFAMSMPVNKRTIVIDAGHGGWDPGKVSSNNTKEKDINLQIAELLQMYLEQGGCQVLITRSDDEALADKKAADLDERLEIAQSGGADLYISIHQNSYTEESAQGAQVFYYSGSEEGQRLAEAIQSQLINHLNQTKKREAKSNSDYYILKNSAMPAVIVECGFLSNASEQRLLADEEYQQKVAWAIYMGIINYYSMEHLN